jgi:glutathione S-transferase
MPAKLFVVHGSHPCVTVARALELKGIAFKTVELPPPSHALIMRARFGNRTVPAIVLEDGTKLQGSRKILAALDERVPDPPLLPADAAQAAEVLDAERWGEEVLQHLAREVLWPTLLEHPACAPSFSEGGKLPLPGAVLKAAIPVIGRVENRMNRTDKDVRAQRLAELPAHLDRIDAWIADGVLGGSQLNRADLQIGPSLALLRAMGDLADLIDPRPLGRLAAKFDTVGSIPRGALSVPQPAAA